MQSEPDCGSYAGADKDTNSFAIQVSDNIAFSTSDIPAKRKPELFTVGTAERISFYVANGLPVNTAFG